MNRLSCPSIIDIEASGFGNESYPIEIGVALEGGAKYCALIAPAPAWTHWDDEAEKVHHVSRDMLKSHGKNVQVVTQQLNNLLSGKVLYSDGWVVDYPWLIRLFSAAGNSMDFRVSPLELILTEAQMSIWHQTKDRVVDELKLSRHRASHDAWILQETFRQTFEQTNCHHHENMR